MDEERICLEEVLRSDELDREPVAFQKRLLDALMVFFIALGITVIGALAAVGVVTVWFAMLINS